MRSTVERRDSIIQLIQEHGKVRVDDLSERFDVSSVTIRNDLDFLEKKGICHRTHGGALIRKNVYEDPTLEEKQKRAKKEKELIGEKAAEFIEDGDSILFDSGSTTLEIAHRLTGIKNLTIMTNSLNIALKLLNSNGMNIMMTGGTIRKESYSMVGPDAENSINKYYFDKLFLGVDGLDIDYGLTTPNPMEAQLNRLMVERSQEVIAVTDSSKFGRKSFSHICDIDSINTLITDKNISTEFEKELLKRNVNVIKV
jgi:DeoR family transcriptional regulator, aga operon transcriptional repressor